MLITIEAFVMNKQTIINLSGIAGILGGLILFAGDMMFYYSDSSQNLMQNIGMVSGDRIVWSAATALLAAWLYTAGIVSVHHAFGPSKPAVRAAVTICFAAIAIGYGVVHAVFTGIGESAQLAITHKLDFEKSVELSLQVNELLRLMIYPFFLVLTVLFIHQVWTGKTLYPRWMVFGFPLVLFILQGPITAELSGTAYVIIAGGYLNLQMVIFFLCSTIALRRAGQTT